MRLPEDYDDRQGMTPAVLSALVAVTLFVAVILVVVLAMNGKKNNNRGYGLITPTNTPSSVILSENSNEQTGLKPEDLDFWDMYPTETPMASVPPNPSPTNEVAPNDPSTDGKHTLVQLPDGKEEWVLISPYLKKHEYDFTKLVCQSDFMKYYVDGKLTSYIGVDISKYQDYIDFVKLKKAGVSFAMIRVGARGYGSGQLVMDENFSDNIKRATDAGLMVGAYFSSQAITVDEAVEEADMVLAGIEGYRLDYPIAFDMELVANDSARIDALSRAEKTDITKAFLETIEAAGHKVCIYGNKEWLIKEIDMSKLSAYDVWLSQIADLPDYPYKFTIWQYKDDASLDGISGYVNLNVSFVDYAEK